MDDLFADDGFVEDWFTAEQLDEGTYVISEYRHWEETHCYLLCGAERAILIDTGLGVGEIGRVVRRLTVLPVQVITTHAHWDHIGGHRCFTDIAVHEAERDWVAGHFPLPRQAVLQNLMRPPHDFPPDFGSEQTEQYQIYAGGAQTLLRDGDCIALGGRSLQVLHTPGHSPGHCCFFEPERGWLYAGDLVYLGCLDAFYPTTDPVLFYHSVQKLLPLPVRRILPGHHALAVPLDLPERIAHAFSGLERAGTLRQGVGIFDFGDFQLHL